MFPIIPHVSIFNAKKVYDTFFANGGITDPTEKSAVVYLHDALKSNNFWSRYKALYPIVGGTSTAHKLNLIKPTGLTADHTIDFYNSPTHSANGIAWDGTTQYGDTNCNSNILGQNNAHVMVYLRDNTIKGNGIDIGNYPGSSFLGIYARDGGNLFYGNANDGGFQTQSSSDSTGLQMASRVDAVEVLHAIRNSQWAVAQSSASPQNANIHIGKGNIAGGWYSDRQVAGASIGFGFTTAEMATLYTIWQTYQTMLSRQV